MHILDLSFRLTVYHTHSTVAKVGQGRRKCNECGDSLAFAIPPNKNVLGHVIGKSKSRSRRFDIFAQVKLKVTSEGVAGGGQWGKLAGWGDRESRSCEIWSFIKKFANWLTSVERNWDKGSVLRSMVESVIYGVPRVPRIVWWKLDHGRVTGFVGCKDELVVSIVILQTSSSWLSWRMTY